MFARCGKGDEQRARARATARVQHRAARRPTRLFTSRRERDGCRGASGLARFQHIAQAELFESLLRADARFALTTPRSLALLCFQLLPSGVVNASTPLSDADLAQANALTKRLEDVVNTRGIFVVHTELKGRYVVRFVPGSPWTQDSHIRNAWAIFQQAATDVLAEPSA